MLPFSDKPIQKPIVRWFEKVARDLPWRKTSDPYAIWISEVMLQQTQVATVITYYEKWMKLFPNVEALAAASESDVLNAWKGLGYYRRAKNLKKGAELIAEKFKGEFPKTREELLLVPGIGAYSAGSILSIAFRIPTAALDGNFIRVYSRLFAIEAPVDETQTLKLLWKLAEAHLPKKGELSREFTEGMMELGATLCTPRNPKCLLCPVRNLCRAFQQNKVEAIPRKSKKQKRLKLLEKIWVMKRLVKGELEEWAVLPPGSDSKFKDFWRLPFELIDEQPKSFDAKIKYSVTIRDVTAFVIEQEKLKARFSSSIEWRSKEELLKLHLPKPDREILANF